MRGEFTAKQDAAIDNLRRAVKACTRSGVVLVADLDAQGIVAMTKAEYDACDDLREADGESIELKSACGGRTGSSCSFMTVPM